MRLVGVTVALSVLVVLLCERKIGFGDKEEAGFELEEREGNTQQPQVSVKVLGFNQITLDQRAAPKVIV